MSNHVSVKIRDQDSQNHIFLQQLGNLFFQHTLYRVLSSKHFNDLAVSKILCKHWCVYCRGHENYSHVWECMNHISQHYEQEICLQYRKVVVQYHSYSRISFKTPPGLIARTEGCGKVIFLYLSVCSQGDTPYSRSRSCSLHVTPGPKCNATSQMKCRKHKEILTLISRSWISSTTTWDIPLKPPSSFLSIVPNNSEKNQHIRKLAQVLMKK